MKGKLWVTVWIIFSGSIVFPQNSHSGDSSYLLIDNVYMKKDSVNFLYDPDNTMFRAVIVKDFAFLVDDTDLHTYTVDEIHRIKRGYLVGIHTRICDTTAYVQVVSVKGKGFRGKKIKEGASYRMQLLRYFAKPLDQSLENKRVYSVLIGKKSLGVVSTGRFNYLFVSPNLNGLFYRDSMQIEEINAEMENRQEKMEIFLCEVLGAMIFKEDSCLLLNYMDRKSVKRSLRQYSIPYEYYHHNTPISNPPKKIERYDWKIDKIDTKSLESWLWDIIKEYYGVPREKTSPDESLCNDGLKVKILYCQKNLYTVRVAWNAPFEKHIYYAFFTMKESKEGFKIVGFHMFRS